MKKEDKDNLVIKIMIHLYAIWRKTKIKSGDYGVENMKEDSELKLILLSLTDEEVCVCLEYFLTGSNLKMFSIIFDDELRKRKLEKREGKIVSILNK